MDMESGGGSPRNVGHGLSKNIIDIKAQGPIEGIRVHLRDFCDDTNGKSSTVTAYLGIPFAQPPIGLLRWKRPQQPAPSWNVSSPRPSVWQCDPIQNLSQSASFQRPRRNGASSHSTISEDCLYLNIWVPDSQTTDSQTIPVLVWVYGGAFAFGAASQPDYDGARLSNETQCIVVNLTYRVGPFGWLGSRELARQETQWAQKEDQGTGNYGAWDVIAGLEWVKSNIGSFGGDASNVTIFGESAGSIMIHYLLLSPETPADLFSRAILQSGTAVTLLPRTLASAQATFDDLAVCLGASASATDKEKMAILYEASADSILAATSSFKSRRPRTEYIVDASNNRPERRMDHDQSCITLESQSLFSPVWDGVFVSHDFLNLVQQGLPKPETLRNGQKGMMIGYCADEGTIFNMNVCNVEELQRHASAFHPHLLPFLTRLYGLDIAKNDDDAFAACASYTGDILFHAPIRALMLQLAKQSQLPSYAYIFAHRRSTISIPALMNSKRDYGVTHMADLPFVFGFDGNEDHTFERDLYPGSNHNIHQTDSPGFDSAERKLSLMMMHSISQFARQKAPWIAMRHNQSVEQVEDCLVLAIGCSATLGSRSVAAPAALESSKVLDIPVSQEQLGRHPTWTEKVGPCDALATVGSQKEKQAFWEGDGFKNLLIQFYGDERISFIP